MTFIVSVNCVQKTTVTFTVGEDCHLTSAESETKQHVSIVHRASWSKTNITLSWFSFLFSFIQLAAT